MPAAIAGTSTAWHTFSGILNRIQDAAAACLPPASKPQGVYLLFLTFSLIKLAEAEKIYPLYARVFHCVFGDASHR